jgi:hypothetical protein
MHQQKRNDMNTEFLQLSANCDSVQSESKMQLHSLNVTPNELHVVIMRAASMMTHQCTCEVSVCKSESEFQIFILSRMPLSLEYLCAG